MDGRVARVAARESGDERVQSLTISEIFRDVSAPLDMTQKSAFAVWLRRDKQAPLQWIRKRN